jgi:hypothetical protein
LAWKGTGYYYQQVTGDSGVGATLGDFEGRVTALGGILTYDFALGKIPVSTMSRTVSRAMLGCLQSSCRCSGGALSMSAYGT